MLTLYTVMDKAANSKTEKKERQKKQNKIK